MAVRPIDEYIKLLLDCNGADGSTAFLDKSYDHRTITVQGGAQLDQDITKWGTASGLFSAAGDYLTIPYVTTAHDWWADDYRIDAWVYIAEHSGRSDIKMSPLIGNMDPTGATDNVFWAFGPNADGKLSFYYKDDADGDHLVESTGTISLNTWTHVQMSQVVGTIYLFIDGTLDGSAAISGTPVSDDNYPLCIAQNAYISAVEWCAWDYDPCDPLLDSWLETQVFN